MQRRVDWLCLLSPTKSVLTLLQLVAALTGVKASSCWCLAVSVWPLMITKSPPNLESGSNHVIDFETHTRQHEHEHEHEHEHDMNMKHE